MFDIPGRLTPTCTLSPPKKGFQTATKTRFMARELFKLFILSLYPVERITIHFALHTCSIHVFGFLC